MREREGGREGRREVDKERGREGGRYAVIHCVYISLFGIEILYLCQDLQKRGLSYV